jgi:hypothetical protein
MLATVGVAAYASDAEAAPTPNGQIKGKGGNIGVGISLGDPMGASAKFFLAANHALQLDLGWAPLHHGHGTLTFAYLWHPGVFVSNSTMDFLPYLGVGLGLGFWASHGHYCGSHHGGCGHGGGAGFLIRVPVLGLGFHWKAVPLDTMLEGAWSPYMVRSPGVVDLPHGDVSFKLRYYF